MRRWGVRVVIYGPGAVGGTIGGRLAQHGHDVALIARGAHGEAIGRDGLRLRTPDGDHVLRLPVVDRPGALSLGAGDVVVLAMKTQHTEAALDELAAAAPADLPVVCAQNGVENERLALRRFANVHAMCVMLPGTHLEPGVVVAHGAPRSGILDRAWPGAPARSKPITSTARSCSSDGSTAWPPRSTSSSGGRRTRWPTNASRPGPAPSSSSRLHSVGGPTGSAPR